MECYKDTYRRPDIFKCYIYIFGLPTCLIIVTRLETKQSSAQPPFHATVTDSLVACAFGLKGLIEGL